VNGRHLARGFAYVEVLVAALILGLCAVPAANALRNGLDAGPAGSAKAAELYCVRNLMETVLAEPYMSLNTAAGTSNYNLTVDDTCALRTVTIERKLFDGAKLTDLPASATNEQRDTALLKIKVEMTGSPYAFSTVVAR
jgi:Tfp pilus assembly protein PilV